MPSARSGCARTNIAACGLRSAPASSSTPAAARGGSTMPATAPPTHSIAPTARRTRREPATIGLRSGCAWRGSRSAPGRRSSTDCCGATGASQHVAAEIGVLGDSAELLLDEGGVDDQGLAAPVLGLEAHLLEQFLHHRLEPPRADILDRFIDLGGDAGERLDPVVGELDRHALR